MNQVVITTTTHALAVWVYALQGVQAVLYLIGLAQAKSMTILAGPIAVDVWSIIVLFASVVAVAATRLAKTSPRHALRYELIAALTIAAGSLWYEYTLFIANGPTEVVTTQSYALTIAFGCLARAWQIRRETKKLGALDRGPRVEE